MKIRLLFLSWLTSILILLGSTLEARAASVGLDFGLSQRDSTAEESGVSPITDAPNMRTIRESSRVNETSPGKASIEAAKVEAAKEASLHKKQDRISTLTVESPSISPSHSDRDSGMLNFSVGDEFDNAAVDATVASIGTVEGFGESTAITAATVQNIEQSAVVALRRAIVGQESGGKFDIVNPHSGALGYAQLMPANVKAWGRQALGYAPSKRAFLSKPDLQLRIIDHKLRQYWQEELQATAGNEQEAVLRVASRWYSGNANLYTSTRPQYYRAKNGKHYRYPSISAYSWSVWRKYQQQGNH